MIILFKMLWIFVVVFSVSIAVHVHIQVAVFASQREFVCKVLC